MTQQLDFPGPEPSDPEDVSWQLQTAGTMWNRGDTHEAIRWLRRAAEAAGESGADMRAVTLARAAADLTTALQIPPSMPPPAPSPATPRVVPPSHTPPPPSARAPSGPRTAPPPRSVTPPPGEVAAVRPSTRPPAHASNFRQRQALRVAVHPTEGTNDLVVRPLGEDEAPGEGEHEALLVALEAGAHLLSKKR